MPDGGGRRGLPLTIRRLEEVARPELRRISVSPRRSCNGPSRAVLGQYRRGGTLPRLAQGRGRWAGGGRGLWGPPRGRQRPPIAQRRALGPLISLARSPGDGHGAPGDRRDAPLRLPFGEATLCTHGVFSSSPHRVGAGAAKSCTSTIVGTGARRGGRRSPPLRAVPLRRFPFCEALLLLLLQSPLLLLFLLGSESGPLGELPFFLETPL